MNTSSLKQETSTSVTPAKKKRSAFDMVITFMSMGGLILTVTALGIIAILIGMALK